MSVHLSEASLKKVEMAALPSSDGALPAFVMLPAPRSSKFKEMVKRGFILKEIVSRRHRSARRCNPPHPAPLPRLPSPKAGRMRRAALLIKSLWGHTPALGSLTASIEKLSFIGK